MTDIGLCYTRTDVSRDVLVDHSPTRSTTHTKSGASLWFGNSTKVRYRTSGLYLIVDLGKRLRVRDFGVVDVHMRCMTS